MGIKFGTDGWRGIIAKDFTFTNVEKVARAHALCLKERKNANRVIIGYDHRFMSENFAQTVAETFVKEGFEVNLIPHPTTTPFISWAVKYKNYDNGIMITASHNPPIYNGYKIKDYFGGSATEDFLRKIENKIKELEKNSPEKCLQKGDLIHIDEREEYINAVRSQVNLEIFKEKNIKIIHDPMYGSATGLLQKALTDTKIEVLSIRSYRDPLFGGHSPEPVEKNASLLKEKVRAEKAFCGIMNDGDGDRIALIDEKGNYINSQLIYALLLLHLLENKGLRGIVVKTVSTTFLADMIAQKYGVKLYTTKVGFKHINEVVLKNKNVIFGGEESGGYGFPYFTPERDGLLSALYLLEMFLLKEKTPSETIEELFREFSPAYYKRIDIRIEEKQKEKLKFLKENPPSIFAGRKVEEIDTLDGLKLIFENKAWLLIRPSGTEPLLRLYAESPDKKEVEIFLNHAREFFS